MCKKSEIINSARNLFKEYGYKKVSMNEIAASANVTKKTIYTYFKDKDELFQYFINEELDEMRKMFENQISKEGNISNKISLGIHDALEFRKNSPLVKSIIKEQELSGKDCSNFLSQYDDEIINYLEVKIKEEIEKGTIKKCNAKLTAYIIYKIFFLVFFEYKEELEEDEIIEEVSSILHSGLIKGGKEEYE